MSIFLVCTHCDDSARKNVFIETTYISDILQYMYKETYISTYYYALIVVGNNRSGLVLLGIIEMKHVTQNSKLTLQIFKAMHVMEWNKIFGKFM